MHYTVYSFKKKNIDLQTHFFQSFLHMRAKMTSNSSIWRKELQNLAGNKNAIFNAK